jgi:hypothetical protein
MVTNKHIHKYQKEVLGKDYRILRCHIPGCNHYIRESLGIGKLSLCNRCNEPIVLTSWHLQRKKPHCQECTKDSGFAKKYKKVDEVSTDRLKELLTADDLLKKVLK